LINELLAKEMLETGQNQKWKKKLSFLKKSCIVEKWPSFAARNYLRWYFWKVLFDHQYEKMVFSRNELLSPLDCGIAIGQLVSNP